VLGADGWIDVTPGSARAPPRSVGGMRSCGDAARPEGRQTAMPHTSSVRRRPGRLPTVALVVTLVAGLLGATTTTAQAAVVVSASTPAVNGPYLASGGCQQVVSITARASFSEPARFAEALLDVDGPALVGGRAANDTGSFTSKSFTWNIPVSSPGTYTAAVRWSAHNGNGLSQGVDTSEQVTFEVPEPAPLQRFSAVQKCVFDRTAALYGILGVGATAVGILGAVLCPPCAVVATVVGALGLLAGGLAAHSGYMALDPPDGNYTTLPEPDPPPVPAQAAGGQVSPAAAAALDALLANQAEQLGLARAALTAVERAQGARLAGATTWEAQQMVAAGGFAREQAALLQAEPGLRRAARDALEDGGFPNPVITAEQIEEAQIAWADGPPATVVEQMDALGFTAADAAQVAGQIAMVDPEAASMPLLDLLVEPVAMAQAEALAVELGAFADAVEEDPLTTGGAPDADPGPEPLPGGDGDNAPGPAPAGGVDLVVDGSFEPPRVPAPAYYENVTAGEQVGAWTVSSASVDVLGDDWQAADGTVSLDLSGNQAGSVYQDLPTVPGREYVVNFALAGNADGPPDVKQLRVTFGAAVEEFAFSQGDHTEQDMGWVRRQLGADPTGPNTASVRVTAVEESTRLEFTSLTEGFFGAAIDDVQVREQGDGSATPRIGGPDVRRVAIALCTYLFPSPDQAAGVVLARDDVFADALAGAPLAGDDHCVLYTGGGPDAPLDPDTRAAIDRALPDGGPIAVLGGDQAVSAAAESELVAAGYGVRRYAGASRFETAVDIARDVRGTTPESTAAMLAFGYDHPDAVTGGAYGAATGTPVLLTDTDVLHPATAAALQELGTARSVVLGGEAVVGGAVLATVPGPERVAGATRMGTAAAVATDLWPAESDGVVVTNLFRDDGWPLTLAGAPLSAREGAPQIGVATDEVPPETAGYLAARVPPAGTAWLLGDESSVSAAVAAEVGAALAPPSG